MIVSDDAEISRFEVLGRELRALIERELCLRGAGGQDAVNRAVAHASIAANAILFDEAKAAGNLSSMAFGLAHGVGLVLGQNADDDDVRSCARAIIDGLSEGVTAARSALAPRGRC